MVENFGLAAASSFPFDWRFLPADGISASDASQVTNIIGGAALVKRPHCFSHRKEQDLFWKTHGRYQER
jgi:hypothetical protein